MSDEAKTIEEQRNSILAAAKQLILDAKADGKEETAEQRAEIDKMLADAEQLRKDAEAARTRAAVEAERGATDELAARMAALDDSGSDEPEGGRELAQARAVMSGRTTEIDLRQVAKVVEMARAGVSPQEARADLLVGTQNAGGVLVPTNLEATLLESLRFSQGIGTAGARVFNTPHGGDWSIPERTAVQDASAASVIAEDADPDTVKSTFGEVTFSAYKFGGTTEITEELDTDAIIDIVGLAARDIGEYISTATERIFTSGGTGSNQPQALTNGVAADQTQTIVRTSKTALNHTDLAEIRGALGAAYLQSGERPVFLMNTNTYTGILGAVDSDGRPVHALATTETPFETLLGYRIHLTEHLQDFGASRNVAVFCIPSRVYGIRQVGGIQLRSSEEAEFVKGATVLRGVIRTDGRRLDSEAMVLARTAA